MPEDTFTIKISKKEVMELVRNMTDFSKSMDTVKKLSEQDEKCEGLYGSLENFGFKIFHTVLSKCPEELVPVSWKLKIMGKWTDRNFGEDEEEG